MTMAEHLLKGKKGIIFGALNDQSIAWKTALQAHSQGAELVLTNAPVAMRMGEIHELAKQVGDAPVVPADATSVEDLTNLFESFRHTIGVDSDNVDNLSLANTRSRLRMATLYQIAGRHRGLVVGTGNKVEDFGVGFYTKYGDGGVDLSPIADLMKSEVYALGKLLEETKSIIMKRL